MDTDSTNAAVVVVALLFYFVILGVPIMQVIHKAGYSRAWILILFVPLVNLVMLWVFAFARWPSVQAAQYGGQQQAYGYGGHPQQGYPQQGGYQQGYPPQQQQGYGGQYQQPPYPPQQGR